MPDDLSDSTMPLNTSSMIAAFSGFSYRFFKSSNKLGTPLRSGFSTYALTSALNSCRVS